MNRSRLEKAIERALFASRWLLAPFYVGLAIALAVLLVVFAVSLWDDIWHLTQTSLGKLPEAAILMSLSMIDLTLTGNLVIIVILSGYENFVSKIEVDEGEGRPNWMGRVDFSNLKIKLIASIVAISAIALLRTYLEIHDHAPDTVTLTWEVGILLTFVVSGVLLALMDLFVSKTESH
ncbi:MAG: TIGR00645 family protein [Caulobacteraceae bacterium]|nr:TIGR00645 family protein [Caulobacteraceae bacterium]